MQNPRQFVWISVTLSCARSKFKAQVIWKPGPPPEDFQQEAGRHRACRLCFDTTAVPTNFTVKSATSNETPPLNNNETKLFYFVWSPPWHISWSTFLRSIWHSIWHIFWQFTWHSIWHISADPSRRQGRARQRKNHKRQVPTQKVEKEGANCKRKHDIKQRSEHGRRRGKRQEKEADETVARASTESMKKKKKQEGPGSRTFGAGQARSEQGRRRSKRKEKEESKQKEAKRERIVRKKKASGKSK